MKNIALSFSATACLFFAACAGSEDHPPKDSGQQQIPAPVVNSGPETEAARANKAVQDTSEKSDKKDSVATSNDHKH